MVLKGLFEDINLQSKYLEDIKTGRYTSCSLDLSLDKEKININLFNIKDGLLDIKMTGNIFKRKESVLLDIKANYHGLVSDTFKLFNLSRLTTQKNGIIDFKLDVEGDVNFPKATFNLKAENLLLDWANLDSFDITGSFNENKISVNNLFAKKDIGTLKLKEPIDLYDIKGDRLISKKLEVSLNKLHTNDGLYVIDDILSNLKGHLTGDVVVSFDEKNLAFLSAKGFSS